ncbi:MAG: hypothetical protein WBM00_06245 [Solirubrobacterales bacterium]
MVTMAVEKLTDFETRVLGVLGRRSGLDLEQLASAGRLPITATAQALEGLLKNDLAIAESGRFGPTFKLNRRNVQKLIAA